MHQLRGVINRVVKQPHALEQLNITQVDKNGQTLAHSLTRSATARQASKRVSVLRLIGNISLFYVSCFMGTDVFVRKQQHPFILNLLKLCFQVGCNFSQPDRHG